MVILGSIVYYWQLENCLGVRAVEPPSCCYMTLHKTFIVHNHMNTTSCALCSQHS